MVGDLWFPPPSSLVPSFSFSVSGVCRRRLRFPPPPSPVPSFSFAVSGGAKTWWMVGDRDDRGGWWVSVLVVGCLPEP
ncbi:hypothetical protein HanRHA438_Chr12g0557821 [Helianthus annuus]|uniref:Uncharacterized protein n=1 Tax=Helianthus annuus TaxID=4232 RepID=A0A9K3MWK2_HELAN|nr:hypothetical protein HanXRQr2_Chr12g0546491 [Helianthus annuus]KAJ0489769.1 hypothetical protein HanHA300_Chr12g0447741 [Helianthus annuus]KAJ0493758.1 hypothetical protein HanIR_Chr12g0589701 [Helianthus annuus]KAJ0675353.1 hypothetical protein HanLR1_Chr12g0450191 [Helianthus annuus]KAJ0678651.1 hypothetical protein HanOQP8_Chr12g0450281 [Helianthus annuus]